MSLRANAATATPESITPGASSAIDTIIAFFITRIKAIPWVAAHPWLGQALDAAVSLADLWLAAQGIQARIDSGELPGPKTSDSVPNPPAAA